MKTLEYIQIKVPIKKKNNQNDFVQGPAKTRTGLGNNNILIGTDFKYLK